LSSLDIQADGGASTLDPAASKLIDGKFEPSGALQSV
jgi:hypothetical protein